MVVCFSCACLMRPPSLGTKPYQAHYLSVRCVLRAHVQFCQFDKRTPPPTLNYTAITDRHSSLSYSTALVPNAHVQFCQFDKRTPPPTLNYTAITDRHSSLSYSTALVPNAGTDNMYLICVFIRFISCLLRKVKC